jgi:8-oxo-dGTP pyrophosphatase MutT (NUDIX family)
MDGAEYRKSGRRMGSQEQTPAVLGRVDLGRFQSLRQRVVIETLRRLPIPVRWKQVLVWLGSPRRVVGALAIVQDDHGSILLLKSRWLGRWQLPGGTVERNETPLEALQRELNEETGRRITSSASPVIVTEGALPQVLFLYPVTLQPGRFRLSAEHTAWAFHPTEKLPSEVRALIGAATVGDAGAASLP